MMGISDENGQTFGTKKALKAHIGARVQFIETSMFGNEFKGEGSYTVVGPTPHKRVWYATVKVGADGELRKVA